MGNSPSEPKQDQELVLRGCFEERCTLAGQFISEADIFLLCTGAGFSADSGLAVYADVAKVEAYQSRGLGYQDICQPHWLTDEPELFWGFWGQCYNDYRDTPPHEGYEIIDRWVDKRFRSSLAAQAIRKRMELKAVAKEEPMVGSQTNLRNAWNVKDAYDVTGHPGAFFAFTSNVDAHNFDWFRACEIRECHGNTELYQCAALSGPKATCHGVWRAPIDFRFQVDTKTMLVPMHPPGDNSVTIPAESPCEQLAGLVIAESSPELAAGMAAGEATSFADLPHVGNVRGGGRSNLLRYMPSATQAGEETSFCGQHSNFPVCRHCGGPARPAILMFGDGGYMEMESQEKRYQQWLSAAGIYARKVCAETPEKRVKVAILEVGAGGNVTTVRATSEKNLALFRECGADVRLVRVNPTLPFGDADEYKPGGAFESAVISLMGGGLETIRRIDAAMTCVTI